MRRFLMHLIGIAYGAVGLGIMLGFSPQLDVWTTAHRAYAAGMGLLMVGAFLVLAASLGYHLEMEKTE